MPDSAPPADDVPQKLSSLRMFLTVFTAVQFVIVGVVVFSVNKMRLALVPDPVAPFVFLTVAAVVAVVVGFALQKVLAMVRQSRVNEPDVFARYSSEILVRSFLVNLPAVILVMGYVLTAQEWLLVPAAVGLLVVWATRPTRAQYDRWLSEAK